MKPKILVSACLMGQKVRYDGKHNLIDDPRFKSLKANNQLILACPETLGGLPTPREPAEIITTDSNLKIQTKHKKDVTAQFLLGANKTYTLCQDHQIRIALMAAKSPSCGNIETYNGEFNRTLIKQAGVSAELLIRKGIKVFNQNQLDAFFLEIEGL